MNLKIIQSDITTLQVDAIVNAVNSSLMGGGGVDGAIHRAAGSELLKECKEIRKKLPNGLPTGEAVLTKGYNLPSKYVIHTVGPVYNKNKDQSQLLANCFKNSLDIAENHNLKSIAFPAISTGVYGYPKKEAAEIVKKVFDDYKYKNIKEVIVCLFSDEDKGIWEKVFN